MRDEGVGSWTARRARKTPGAPAIRSTARSASRHDAGRSPNASCVTAVDTGTSPLARTPTSRSRAPVSSPAAAYSSQATV